MSNYWIEHLKRIKTLEEARKEREAAALNEMYLKMIKSHQLGKSIGYNKKK